MNASKCFGLFAEILMLKNQSFFTHQSLEIIQVAYLIEIKRFSLINFGNAKLFNLIKQRRAFYAKIKHYRESLYKQCVLLNYK